MPPTSSRKTCQSALNALTSAALLLPGLAAKAEDSAEFHYSHFQEGKRNLADAPSNMNPIEVDSVHGHVNASLTDRIKFAFDFTQDTWSGATAVATAPVAGRPNRPIERNIGGERVITGASPFLNTNVRLNRGDLNLGNLNNIQLQGDGNELVHVMAEASPETRTQGDFRLTYEWDEATLTAAGGLSIEKDFESAYGSLSGTFDFNQKNTTLKWGASYTDSDIYAILDHDILPYVTRSAFADQLVLKGGSEIVTGNKNDFAFNLGLTQVLSKNAWFDAAFGYTHSDGFMENPFKAVTVIFIDPGQFNSGAQVLNGDVRAVLEQRPDIRNQWAFSSKYAHYIEPLDSALHFQYKFSHDDWGIDAHTFELNYEQPLGSGWTVTPKLRYYSQSQARFFTNQLLSLQNFRDIETDDQGRQVFVNANNPTSGELFFRDDNFDLVDANGAPVDETLVAVQPKFVDFDFDKLPDSFSSDHRLAGFGTLSAGLTVTKEFTRGLTVSAGFEYYAQAGDFKLGGGGRDDFADFEFFVANAGIKVNLEQLHFRGVQGIDEHAHHDQGHSHHHHGLPSGVMFGHMISEADRFMIGYKLMYASQDGDMLNGNGKASDLDIVNFGCSDAIKCRFTPTYMNMRMHMINLMYAPTDWLNLMLMPTFMDMDMNIRELDGRPPPEIGVHEHQGIVGHATGGVGDTRISALLKLWDSPGHHLHAGLGLSAPTGDVDLEFRRQFQIDGGLVHFGMQLGSGTWDFLPSLTYTGDHDDWLWGAQLSAVKRLEDRNESGYRLGNQWQATAWGGYRVLPWLSGTVRGVYSAQGAIRGDFNKFNGRSGPMDFPANHGGEFWDVGFGVTVSVPGGRFAGNQFSFEWLQPVSDDVNGFRLERESALSASWSYSF